MRGKVLRCAPNTNSFSLRSSPLEYGLCTSKSPRLSLFCTFRGLAPAGQSSPLRSEHEQPALRAAGSTCCYDQKETGRLSSSCFFLVHLQGLEPGTH